MKKLLLFAMIIASPALHAQLTLTGTSYTQNFDGLATGLPTGWTLADSAKANFLGQLIPGSFFASPTYGTFGNGTWYSTRGGFKNYPSATVIGMGSDSTTQVTTTNRALGVRQVVPTSNLFPNSDPGAAMILQLANTNGFKSFTATFKLQSLDTSSPRVTTWIVDYGIGATPAVFTPAGVTGTMTTGGNTFTNNTISVDFGSALDDVAQPVWIRLVTLDSSTGSGNRTSTTIDDFNLSWTPLPTAVNTVTAGNNNELQMLGRATSNNIAFRFLTATTGDYKLTITDISGATRYTRTCNVNSEIFPVSVTNLNLAPGMYVARMANNAAVSTVKFIVE